ncbi:hypothetical protein [Pelomicrobium methylotrophicum]|uniref:Uncharacterized protein n=1 Tax=Pelomicrobium methylotrophicum TaxID=2602750 RepID=A0A5C7ESF2_9PROT|nr:hypothetical protein [Pelomicrobium methylotrophicum]TXF11597.1 hypothetical protein FR698_09665 [Pelomicrobium methylotrophicum]
MGWIRIFLIAAALFVPSWAGAFRTVFDPWNFGKTTITAQQSVIAEQQRYTSILYEIKQLETMYRNLEPAKAGLLADQVLRNATLAPLYQAYVEKLADLSGALGDQRSFYEQIRASYAASDLSMESWADRMTSLLGSKDARAQQLYRMGSEVIRRVRDAITSRNALYERILNAGGALEVSQTTAAVLAQVEANTSDMNALWAGIAQRMAAEDAEKIAEKEYMENRRREIKRIMEEQDKKAIDIR